MFGYDKIICMKKQDYILAGLILIISLALNLYISSYANKNDMSGNYVVVYVDGDLFEKIPISDNGEHEIVTKYGTNVIGIYDGRVGVTSADCKSWDCIKMGKISNVNEYICCLPHRLYIVIEGEDVQYDTVAY